MILNYCTNARCTLRMLHGLDSNRSVTEFDSGFVPDVPKIFAKVSQEFVI